MPTGFKQRQAGADAVSGTAVQRRRQQPAPAGAEERVGGGGEETEEASWTRNGTVALRRDLQPEPTERAAPSHVQKGGLGLGRLGRPSGPWTNPSTLRDDCGYVAGDSEVTRGVSTARGCRWGSAP